MRHLKCTRHYFVNNIDYIEIKTDGDIHVLLRRNDIDYIEIKTDDEDIPCILPGK